MLTTAINKMVQKSQLKGHVFDLQTYETFKSTLTPGPSLPAAAMASVEMVSTKVAVTPPCKVPPMFKCDSSTVISHTHCPWEEDTNCTCSSLTDRGHRQSMACFCSTTTYRFQNPVKGTRLCQNFEHLPPLPSSPAPEYCGHRHGSILQFGKGHH